MTDFMFVVHQWLGYAVAAVVLVVALMAFGRSKDAREFTPGPYVLATVLIDLQVLAGILLYGVGAYWDGSRPEIAYLHPVMGVLALVVAHLGLRRARREQMVVAGHRKAGRALVAALVLLLLNIAVALAPPFL